MTHPPAESAPQQCARASAPGAALHHTVSDRRDEEAFAKAHSNTTRILGWLSISYFVLLLGTRLLQGTLDLSAFCWLAAGIMIKEGRQSAVRFVAFLGLFISIVGITQLVGLTALETPIEVGRKWCGFKDFELWSGFISHLGYMGCLGTLALATLRARQLSFWTRTVKLWGGIIGALLLILTTFGVWQSHRAGDIARERADEIELVRTYVRTFGTSWSTTSSAIVEKMESNPRIRSVRIHSSPSSLMILLERKKSSDSKPETRKFTEFLRDSSGNWIMIEIEFLSGDAS